MGIQVAHLHGDGVEGSGVKGGGDEGNYASVSFVSAGVGRLGTIEHEEGQVKGIRALDKDPGNSPLDRLRGVMKRRK